MLPPYRHEEGALVLDCFPLEQGTGKGAVVICPGGGYAFLSDRESEPIARAFNREGYYAFVVRYEVKQAPLGYAPMLQAAKAVAYVRAKAERWGIGSRQIALCGFSAGGHLAASLGTMWHREELFEQGIDLSLQRPDALILSYPVITAGKYRHERSFQRLAGEDQAGKQRFSAERLVDGNTPPTFLWHTVNDDNVLVENSLLFFQALREAGVETELHLYPKGAHGLSLATPDVSQPWENRNADPHVATWFSLAVQWLDGTLK